MVKFYTYAKKATKKDRSSLLPSSTTSPQPSKLPQPTDLSCYSDDKALFDPERGGTWSTFNGTDMSLFVFELCHASHDWNINGTKLIEDKTIEYNLQAVPLEGEQHPPYLETDCETTFLYTFDQCMSF